MRCLVSTTVVWPPAASVYPLADHHCAELGHEFIRLLPTLYRLLVAAMHESPGAAGMNLAQFRVLARLNERDHRAAELAAALEIGRPTLTVTTEHLVRRGLVERQRKLDQDRRGVLLRLTPAGQELFRSLRSQAAGTISGLLGQASAAERDGLELGLSALRRSLHQAGHSLPPGLPEMSGDLQ
jgi:DNA-binding MarR family transcriptional regulator